MTETDATAPRPNLATPFVADVRQQFGEAGSLIHHCLRQLDDDQVWWRPNEGMNSIGNLLLHLAGNLRQRIVSFIGGEPDTRDRPSEFTERGPIPKGDLLARFDEALRQADAVIASLSAERLAEIHRYDRLDGSTEQTVIGLVIQILAHLHGHAQEILAMTRMQLGRSYEFMKPSGVPTELKG
ncbi:MAG: DUF1572 family protein [Isosphaeraceae bacterium]